jgi:multiple sugar transport system permease protein
VTTIATRTTSGFEERVARAQRLRRIRSTTTTVVLTALTIWLAALYLQPLYYAILNSLSGPSREADAPNYPAKIRSVTIDGQQYELYRVPIDGVTRELALVDKGRRESVFVDPANPDVRITWEGRWRELPRVWDFAPQWENYGVAWGQIEFGKLLRNTMIVAGLSTLGVLLSGILVAYGFARFPLPYKGLLISILMSTVILPTQVTIVPTYIIFYKIGWVGTWLPLIVPAFFGNAYSIFLLRQFFMNIPREFDEAAMIDGASPLRILISIIVPLSWPAIISVAITHFVFAWNDFYYAVLYLAGKNDLMTISPALLSFNSVYGGTNPQLISAASMLASLFPIALFFLAQRPFMRAVMMPGLDK